LADFRVENKQFLFNDRPVRILAGAIHYFRVVPEYWRDRLMKLKACGFNTVETYIAWNIHEPVEGRFCFEGIADLGRFIETAAELDLFVIVRPSPYICAEWEFGGIPAWLLADPGMELRCSHPAFLNKVDRYYDVILPLLRPYLCTNGGPIIAMQIENEYGSYGNDQHYLEYLRQAMIARGMDVLLFTSDGPDNAMIQGGMVPGVLETVNFGSGPHGAFDLLQTYQEDQPLMCAEYWNGWFDHWGEEHHTRESADAVKVLDEMLSLGASVNFYMFHGGTNFGFYNGANHFDHYAPTITSYDYDAPLSEAGDPTDKYYAVRNIIEKYEQLEPLVLPEPIPKKDYGKVTITQQASLFTSLEQLSTAVTRVTPEPMENLGQDYGFILYTTRVSGPREESELTLQEVRDRAIVFLDGELQGVIDRTKRDLPPIMLRIPPEGADLSILIENMGRTNYGPHLKDRKGITEGIRLRNQFLYNWTIYPLPLSDLTELSFEPIVDGGCVPGFYKGEFYVEELADTFLKLEDWTKGVAYLNGFNLGRYWEIGPQKTLYIPAPLLRKGTNELILFELHGFEEPVVRLQASPDLG